MTTKFITFEGCEGVGKSTQVDLLKKYLEKTHQNAIFLREPGGTFISENIRKIILSMDSQNMTSRCEAMLYASARAQLVEEIIMPALASGKIVVCDRFVDSTYAYQGFARGLGEQFVESLNSLSCGEILPSTTFFLNLDPQKGFERKGGADKNDRLEQEKLYFHQKVYKGYLSASEKFGERIISIDASKSIFQIHNNIISILREKRIVD